MLSNKFEPVLILKMLFLLFFSLYFSSSLCRENEIVENKKQTSF